MPEFKKLRALGALKEDKTMNLIRKNSNPDWLGTFWVPDVEGEIERLFSEAAAFTPQIDLTEDEGNYYLKGGSSGPSKRGS